MKYIIASIGRCGSTLITDLIAQAAQKKIMYANTINEHDNSIIKTHAHFTEEPNFGYKAIFIYGNITNTIASMYKNRVNLKKHLLHLEIKEEHIIKFWKFYNYSKLIAFLYLVKNDKFRFKKNYLSWKKSKNTFFIKYEEYCKNQSKVMEKMSKFLNLKLKNIKIKKRKSSFIKISPVLWILIKMEYKNFFN